MAQDLNIDRACAVLLDAAFMTDTEAAEKHGVTRQTVINYRKRLKTDTELAEAFSEKLNGLKERLDWEGRLPQALRAAMDAMEECFKTLDKRSPQALEAISNALQVLADTALTLRMLDARLNADTAGAQAQADRQVFAAPHASA